VRSCTSCRELVNWTRVTHCHVWNRLVCSFTCCTRFMLSCMAERTVKCRVVVFRCSVVCLYCLLASLLYACLVIAAAADDNDVYYYYYYYYYSRCHSQFNRVGSFACSTDVIAVRCGDHSFELTQHSPRAAEIPCC